ncbi:MAG: DUF72 domain-containing protein, partial [Chloroflexi bacterium]|nr:DUF72 domain-containing protein [Chloroflexota bacterium]
VNLDRFAHFLAALPHGFTHVVEFRDASWLIDEVFALMEQHQVAHCIHDMGGAWTPLRVTAKTVYLRFHGDQQHGGDYPFETLRESARHIARWRDEHDVYVYFNNDWGGYALHNARTLRRLLDV